MSNERKPDSIDRLVNGLQDALAKASGRSIRGPRKTWPARPVPDKVDPGYCLLADENDAGPFLSEMYHMVVAARDCECNPIEGRLRGPVACGAYLAEIQQKSTKVLQFSPYPELRDDGLRHFTGKWGLPIRVRDFVEYRGTYYNKASALAMQMLARTKDSERVEPEPAEATE